MSKWLSALVSLKRAMIKNDLYTVAKEAKLKRR
jgi:hypothetical protein